ncbi:putative oxidoreductase [Fructobacillus fructosus]|uniref:Uncharacterized protein n=1 Tax=Fructobacillus fructosus TaxID=1631 RepID=A0ABM9N0E8_9LACO|nr:hypothetical protein [Fructobacillus fructosus]KRN51807.1 hypothetical protein IV71_GL000488 [Fructobacillus fructosus KCTC 3544]GAP01776.1 putative oxidoreductase [Fructobacillus fructosus]CAK1252453.1 unnamed protein product [Fructobacillus fructosus]
MAIKGEAPKRSELTKQEFAEMIEKKETAENQQAPSPSLKGMRETKKQYVIMMKPSIHDAGVQKAKSMGLSFSAWLELVASNELNN